MGWAVQLLGTGLDYDYLVSRTLRQDPDVISVSEARTANEAVAAIQAAQTGHVVLATLHEVDPFETISRLEMLDHVRLAPRMICNHKLMIGFMGQRMVPILCGKCKEPLSDHPGAVPAYLLERIGTWGDVSNVHVRGKGCPHCKGRKTVGRKPVAEIVLASEELMEDFLRSDINTARKNHRLRPGSDKSMLAHVMDKVLAGDVAVSDAQSQVAIESYREGR
jgi:type II secretory ATPase GspE/PulE/Tfp pilus assembly ATPase PilB-like protein